MRSDLTFSTLDFNRYYDIQDAGSSKVGNYGEVYKAKHKLLNRYFAVKVLKKTEQNLKYFDNELKILREIDHPNVAKFIEIFVSKDSIHLIMDYYAGSTFKEYLKDHKNLEE